MFAVAIDGPGGAGKSTVAKAAAKKLEFIYVDTGALYRSIGCFVVNSGFDSANETDVINCLDKINIEIKFLNDAQHVFVNDEDYTEKIRTPEMSMAASNVAKIPQVRSFLTDLQRNFAKKYNVIMDGRDIGTVVLPNAELKIFLTASAKARAKRRYIELCEKGEKVNFEDVLADLEQRDYQDSHRDVAPLKAADDAVLVDSGDLTLEQTIDKIVSLIKNAMDNNSKNDDKSDKNGFKNDDTGLEFKMKFGKNKLTMVLRVLLWPIYRLLFWYSIEGKENIPKKGGYIFCSNHVTATDPIFWVIIFGRRLHFMGKEELFHNPFFAKVLKAFDVFAIKRGSGDMSSIQFAVDLVKNGEVMGIFPEGTRSKSGKPGRAKSGVAYIANATGADVIPAAIVCKSGKIKPFSRFKLIIGKPIPHSEIAFDEAAKDNLKRVSKKIMGEIVTLWEENQF